MTLSSAVSVICLIRLHHHHRLLTTGYSHLQPTVSVQEHGMGGHVGHQTYKRVLLYKSLVQHTFIGKLRFHLVEVRFFLHSMSSRELVNISCYFLYHLPAIREIDLYNSFSPLLNNRVK